MKVAGTEWAAEELIWPETILCRLTGKQTASGMLQIVSTKDVQDSGLLGGENHTETEAVVVRVNDVV